MGSLISSGIGSGLDIAGLVRRLVEVEGAPQTARLNLREAEAQAKLSALATIRSALSEFRSALDAISDIDAFRGRTATVSGAEHVKLCATQGAVPAAYELEVEAYATAQKLATAAFADAGETIGTGTLTITVGSAVMSVEIDSEQATLAGIAAAINEAPGNVGVTATVVHGVDGAQLVLSAAETGAANAMTVTQSGGDGGLAALEYDPDGASAMTELRPAANARVLIDGIAVESAGNRIGDAIDGITIELLGPDAVGEQGRLAVAYDRDGARAAIEKLVTAYNALIDAVGTVASYNPETRQSGPLFGDAGLRNLVAQLRRELSSALGASDAPFSLLVEIGVETELSGKLKLDGTKLDAAFDHDFDAVGRLFAEDETGLAARMGLLLEPYLSSGGVFDNRTDGYKKTIERIGEGREALGQRLARLEERLFRQFNALDSLLAQLNSTSNYLAQQLDGLPGFGNLLER
jgi:flagellar hook-associated protein 2